MVRGEPKAINAAADALPTSTVEPMVCASVNHAARLLGQAITRQLAALGLTIGQLPTLLALYERDGQTQTELARRTGVEQPTMAVTLRRMERGGLVTRVPDPRDARRARVHLTPRARAQQEALQSLRAEIDAVALTGFSPVEHDQLRDLIARLIDNLAILTGNDASDDPCATGVEADMIARSEGTAATAVVVSPDPGF
ncbi:MAG: MarR family winged helix-turn-helix transcriptional regulator [Thermomicrobiales bacterium]